MTTATDVTWENIGLRGEQSKKILMLMLIALLMVATFVAILFFKKWIKKVSTGYHEVFVIFLNLCIATVVAIFNSIEGIVIRAFARKELYPYQSKFFKIVAKRLSYVFFTNMVLTTFFANFLFFFESSEKSKLFLPIDYAGLVNDFFVLFLTNSYMSSIFNYLDIFYGIKLLKRRRITRDPLHNPLLCRLHQVHLRGTSCGHGAALRQRPQNPLLHGIHQPLRAKWPSHVPLRHAHLLLG